VATRLLAREGPCVLALLGSGTQAAKHLEAMRCVREITAVHVWSRTKARALAFAESAGIAVTVHDSAEEAVRQADIICTLTPSPSPILKHAWLKSGAHVNAVGSCHPMQQELDEECVTRAAVFCDTREGCLKGLTRTGDLCKSIENGRQPWACSRRIASPKLGKSCAQENCSVQKASPSSKASALPPKIYALR